MQPRRENKVVVPTDPHSHSLPRRRGRPPKVSESNAANFLPTEKVAKRRGRPPKSVRPSLSHHNPSVETDRPRVAYRNIAVPYRILRSHNSNLEHRSQSNEINVQVFNNQPSNPNPNPQMTSRYNLRTVVPRPQRF